MSKFIERLREAHKGVPAEKLVGNYFELLNKIEESKKEQDFNKMLMYCQMSISLIEPLIEQNKKESGSFDIKSIPAIELGAKFWAIYGNTGQLLNLKEVIEYFPELEPWKKTIEEAFTIEELSAKIYGYVKDNEGCSQKDLKKVLGVEDGKLLSNVLYYMELVGKVERRKTGSTYNLFVK